MFQNSCSRKKPGKFFVKIRKIIEKQFTFRNVAHSIHHSAPTHPLTHTHTHTVLKDGGWGLPQN